MVEVISPINQVVPSSGSGFILIFHAFLGTFLPRLKAVLKLGPQYHQSLKYGQSLEGAPIRMES